MGKVNLVFRGVNAYVPMGSGKELLVVMPNATKLGKSRQTALDGSSLSSHMPTFFTRKLNQFGKPVIAVGKLGYFPGARLKFSISGNPTAPDFSALDNITGNKTWLQADPQLLTPTPDKRVSGQVSLRNGVASVATNSCNKSWLKNSDGSSVSLGLAPVILGINVAIDGVDTIELQADRWVDGTQHAKLLEETLGPNDELNLHVGNLCAEDILEWPTNSKAGGRIDDSDLKWIFDLMDSANVPAELPTLEVKGTGLNDQLSASAAMRQAWGGGGGAGCQCNGCGGGG